MKTFKAAIAELKENGNYTSAMADVLQLVQEDKLSLLDLKKSLSLNGLSIDDLKEESLSVVIDYAKDCLKDNILTEQEMQNIKLLKTFLRIREGDFYKKRLKDVRTILTLQLRRMYEDNVIDKSEATMKTDLQELFNLSYDQFLDIVNDVAKEALNRGADIKELDTFFYKENSNQP